MVKSTMRNLRSAYFQYYDLRVKCWKVLDRLVFDNDIIKDGSQTTEETFELILSSWHLRKVSRKVIETVISEIYGHDDWRIINCGTGNRVMIVEDAVAAGHLSREKTSMNGLIRPRFSIDDSGRLQETLGDQVVKLALSFLR